MALVVVIAGFVLRGDCDPDEYKAFIRGPVTSQENYAKDGGVTEFNGTVCVKNGSADRRLNKTLFRPEGSKEKTYQIANLNDQFPNEGVANAVESRKPGCAVPRDTEPRSAPSAGAPNPRAPAGSETDRSTVPGPSIGNSNIRTVIQSRDIAENRRQTELFDSAREILRMNQREALADSTLLRDEYRDVAPEEMAMRLGQAQTRLSDTASDIESSVSGLESSEKNRFRNLYLNARDKAAIAAGTLSEELERKKALGDNSPFADLLSGRNPLAASRGLASVFGEKADKSDATTNDALLDRLVMLNGLGQEKLDKILKQLKLVDKPTLKLATGAQKSVTLLHNGYILGGGASTTDCSAFASAALPADIRKGKFTTLDFRMMWFYRRTAKFPKPPLYNAQREALVKKTSDAFEPVDLQMGDRLQRGDLLVYRGLEDTAGHVFIVKNFDPNSMQVDVLEASQSAGTLRERSLSMTYDPPSREFRRYRPGYFALRLRPTDNKACKYQDRKTAGGPSKPADGWTPSREGSGGAQ